MIALNRGQQPAVLNLICVGCDRLHAFYLVEFNIFMNHKATNIAKIVAQQLLAVY